MTGGVIVHCVEWNQNVAVSLVATQRLVEKKRYFSLKLLNGVISIEVSKISILSLKVFITTYSTSEWLAIAASSYENAIVAS